MSYINDNWEMGGFDGNAEQRLSKELGVSLLTARLLSSRGFNDSDSAYKFLTNSYLTFYDPFLMQDMNKAVDRIKKALSNKERICVYGDYDVDGITSATLLCTYLRSKGGTCGCFIPERISEGYGLNNRAIEALSQSYDLLVTVDTGITAVNEVEYAKALGLDVVITDHHSCREVLPDAVAVVDPHRPDDKYPYKTLAGVGVAFKLVCAIEGNSSKISDEYSDLAAIGTIADVMPLTDENRLIVSCGLKLLESTKRKGISALMREAGVLKRGKRISASTIGYAIAPRLNAAGRIASAMPALELLMAEDDESANTLAQKLCEINLKRQQTERTITYDAAMQIAAYKKDTYAYVLVSENWHQGVIGVVASKISEKYHTPCILLSFNGNGDVARGSGRSIPGFSLMDALNSCSDLLVEYGGHELAAGLSIERDKIAEFTRRFEEIARQTLKDKESTSPLKIDCEVKFDEININNAAQLQKLEPFGLGNPMPTFILKDALINDVIPISEDKHIRLTVSSIYGGRPITCMYFGVSHREFPFCRGDVCELALTLELSEYNGVVSPGVLVKGVRPIEAERLAISRWRRHYESVSSGILSETVPAAVLPTLDDFRLVFRVLRREVGSERKRVSVRYIKRRIEATEGEKTNLCALKVIFDVLTEFGLIDCLRIRSNDVVEVQMLPYNRKIDLEQSEILRKIRLYISEVE